MAVFQTRSVVIAMAIVAVFALIGSSSAQYSPAPAPAPTSSAGVASPSIVAGFAVAVASFVFGSMLRI